VTVECKYRAVETFCKSTGLPLPKREYAFAAPDRKWRFDFCWPDHLLALEVEGGIFQKHGGAHRGIKSYLKDMEKYNAAALHGYKLLRFTPQEIANGKFLHYVDEFFKHQGIKKKELASATNRVERRPSPF